MKLIILFSFTIILFGCQSTDFWDDPRHYIEPGNYSGIFIFTENGNISQGNVRFTFTCNSYTCIPETLYLPPIGGGSYKIINEKIILKDLVPHTAEFDPSLILNGEFLFIKNNETIILMQEDKIRNRSRYLELIIQADSMFYEKNEK